MNLFLVLERGKKMTKKQMLLMTSLAATTLLATTAVLADEVTPTSPVDTITVPSETKPVLPTQPSTDTSSSQGETETPVTPDNPIDGSTSTSQDTKPVTPTEPSKDDDKSSDETKTEQEEPSQPTETPQEDPKGDDDLPTPVEVPTVDGETTTVIPDTSVPTNNPNVTADTAKQAGASQVGTTSTVTGQIVRDVTTANPVTLSNGATITDIRDGQVTLSTGAKVTPESVNITPNADGTYTAKTIQGDMVTLPHTGEKDNRALTILGLITLIISLFVAFGSCLKAMLTKRNLKNH